MHHAAEFPFVVYGIGHASSKAILGPPWALVNPLTLCKMRAMRGGALHVGIVAKLFSYQGLESTNVFTFLTLTL